MIDKLTRFDKLVIVASDFSFVEKIVCSMSDMMKNYIVDKDVIKIVVFSHCLM